MPKYRYVGTVANEVAIDDRRVPLSPGDFIELTAEQVKENPNLKLLEVKATSKEGGESK